MIGIVCTLLGRLMFQKMKPSSSVQPTISSFGKHSKDIMYIFEVKPVYRFRYISPSLDEHIGVGTVEASYADPSDCFDRIHPDDLEILMSKISGNCNYDEPFLQRWRTNDGTYIWFEEYTTPIYENGEIVAVQGVIRNMNAAKVKQQELEQLCQRDTLTGLYNRHAFDCLIEEIISSEAIPLGVLTLDLNDLKRVNDRFGHIAGDALLQQTALCLSRFSQEAFRLGGDEFVIVCQGYTEQQCLHLLEQLRSEFLKHDLSIAVGFAYDEATTDVVTVFQKADQAMYSEKQRTKSLVGLN
ncbi:sensor domain-containing diguanylate cyclase [Exiguobacterium artemiae]|uniref:sensor domain-containing diguanylate cyclase n=1 Tax=Exiguobacterium artemiae TaxID=340145 RepID=UPI003D0297E1